MKNYWTTRARKKRLLKAIDDKLIDCWIDNSSIGEFLNSLSVRERKFFLSLKIIDSGAEAVNNQLDLSISFEDSKG